jgi:hypothetical protein
VESVAEELGAVFVDLAFCSIEMGPRGVRRHKSFRPYERARQRDPSRHVDDRLVRLRCERESLFGMPPRSVYEIELELGLRQGD